MSLFDRYIQQGLRAPTESDYAEFAKLLTPHIRAQARGYTNVPTLDRSGLTNHALCRLLQRLSERAFPLDEISFWPFLTRSIQNALRSAYRDMVRGNPEYIELPVEGDVVAQGTRADATARSTHGDPTYDIDRLVDGIVDRAFVRNRMWELTPGLFRYIAESLLRGGAVSATLLVRFGLPTKAVVGQFVRYVELLVRVAMYEMADTIVERGADGI